MSTETDATHHLVALLAEASQVDKDALVAKINRLGEEMQVLKRAAESLPGDEDLIADMERILPDSSKSARDFLREVLGGEHIHQVEESGVLEFARLLSMYVFGGTHEHQGENLSSWVYVGKEYKESKVVDFFEWCETAQTEQHVSGLSDVIGERPNNLSAKTRNRLDELAHRIGMVGSTIFQMSSEYYDTESFADILKAFDWLDGNS